MHRQVRWSRAFALGAVAILVAACGSGGSATTVPSAPASSQPASSQPASSGPASSGAAAIGPAEQTSLTIAIQLAAVNNEAPYYIAQSKGYFQDEGLTVKVIVAQDPRSAITGGSAEIGTAIAGNVIQAASQNLPLKLIGSHACRQPYSFAVAPGITSAQGLSGKDILIAATAGDPQTTSRKQVLKEAGWDLSAVNPPPNYVNVPGGSNAWAKLFTAGKLFLMPSFDQVRGSLAAYGATFLGDKLEPWPSDYYFAGTSWLASHQNTT
ncbi:MAG: ABC transporter substrate-binding protein, partial [Candidatus Limnocylindrales bacterium]